MSFVFKSILKKSPYEEEKNTEQLYLPQTTPSYSEELEQLKIRVACAYDNLDNVVDPLLIDSWIYEINAAQLRYQFCLQQLKQPSINVLNTEKTGVV